MATFDHDSPLLPSKVALPMALVILNSPIRSPPSPLFRKLWDMSSFRICADGGANRLFDATNKDDDPLVPDMIRGDLDSLRQDVRAYYETRGVRVQQEPDQDRNDMDKALQMVANDHKVCVYGAFGGRFDQEMASIQALFAWKDAFSHGLWLYDDHNCGFLLPQEVPNRIRLNRHDETIREGPTCGLIPIGGPCNIVKTTGLKWNLDGGPLAFGNLVSTSNCVMDDTIHLWSSSPLVFTAEVMCGCQEDGS